MKTRCLLLLILSLVLIGFSIVNASSSQKRVKRQSRPLGGAFPLSRSRQFPPPEELEDSDEYANSEDEGEEPRAPVSAFRGRQPPPPEEEDYSDEYTYTESPKLTTPSPPKATPKPQVSVFNNRFNARPRFGQQPTSVKPSTSSAPTKAATPSTGRFRATPAQSQRLDVIANALNNPVPPRQSPRNIAGPVRTGNENTEKSSTTEASEASTRRNGNTRIRTRGKPRTRSSTTTTTTTTTTTKAPPPEDYYYYYYEDEDEQPKNNQPIATTTSTTTTTTTTTSKPRPSFRLNTRTRTSRPKVAKFDPESQFAPPPDNASDFSLESSSTKRFTTSTTLAPNPEDGGIPPHLRSKYRPRTDGRFIDFLRDPNRPRELKGFDLTDYPFYVKVPEDIDFECADKKDGYYASIPHKCQLFHYCFASARYDFLCANYTLYDQTTFTCRFANNVDCESSAKYYYRNDDLWKETTTTSTTTKKPSRRRPRPKDEDYEEDYYDDDYEEEEEERTRRPPKRRRNRRKNKRKPEADEAEE